MQLRGTVLFFTTFLQVKVQTNGVSDMCCLGQTWKVEFNEFWEELVFFVLRVGVSVCYCLFSFPLNLLRFCVLVSPARADVVSLFPLSSHVFPLALAAKHNFSFGCLPSSLCSVTNEEKHTKSETNMNEEGESSRIESATCS